MFHLVKLLLIYSVPLVVLSPVIDSFFGKLDKTRDDIRILSEIFFHILVLILFWKYLESFIETKFKIKGDNSIIQAIILVGLQTNLIDKLNFITQEHPIRLFKFF
jgi:hypothetical protein